MAGGEGRVLRDVRGDRVDDGGVGVRAVGGRGGGGVGGADVGGRGLVEVGVPDRIGGGLVDVAGAVRVAEGRELVGRPVVRAFAQAQFEADADRLGLQREVVRVRAEDRVEREEPDVVVRRELEHRIPLAGRRERTVGGDGLGVAVGLLVVHQLGVVGGRHEDLAADVAAGFAADEHGRVRRPVAGVLVELERPLHLHFVGLHPVDLGVPRAVGRGPEREDLAVFGAGGILALVLVEVVAAVVGGLDDGGARAQAGRVVAAAVGFQGAADGAGEAVHRGAADLDGLHVEDLLERTRLVVGHQHLTLELAVGVEQLRGGIDEEARDHAVRDHLRHSGRVVRVDPVDRLDEGRGAEELRELAAQVDRGPVVGVVRPVDAARAPLAGRGEHVGHLDARTAGEIPSEDLRAALRGEDALAGRVEEERRIGTVRDVFLVGLGPVRAFRRFDLVAEVVFGLRALEREAALRGDEPHPLLAGDRLRRQADVGDRPDRHRGIHRVGREPGVLVGVARFQQHRRAGNAEGVAGVGGARARRGERCNDGRDAWRRE